jgi:hypothetical protein
MYNVNNPDIIQILTDLTGSKETAVTLYNEAIYLYNKLNNEVFSVHLHRGNWVLVIDGITELMDKSLSDD